jgi:threonylcarbamoyladenosine tRNA methylthiotransferase MtaB
MPHACIGADVIVGFPGETEVDFKDTAEFISSLDISYLHVFTYSERENTQAIEIHPVVPVNIRNERNKLLRNMSFLKMQQFTLQHSEQTRKVLFEGKNKNGMMEGYTDNYIKVTVPYQSALENNITDWKI